LGYLATFDAKREMIFLLGDPIFL